MRVDYGSVSPDIGRVCRAEALTILSDLLEWQLPPAGWDGITALVDQLAEALAAGENEAAQTHVYELEAKSGPRTGGIGAPGDVPPPPPTWDLAVQLVHSLGGTPQDEAPAAAAQDNTPPTDGD